MHPDAYKRENLSLPEAYKGTNPYLSNILITLIREDDMWPGKVALPFFVDENNMEIVWDEMHFTNHLLANVPEEGVSRLVSQELSERRDHYVRYGLAFMLEHGAPKRRRHFCLNALVSCLDDVCRPFTVLPARAKITYCILPRVCVSRM